MYGGSMMMEVSFLLLILMYLTLGAHVHEGYGSQFVCLFVRLFVTNLLTV